MLSDTLTQLYQGPQNSWSNPDVKHANFKQLIFIMYKFPPYSGFNLEIQPTLLASQTSAIYSIIPFLTSKSLEKNGAANDHDLTFFHDKSTSNFHIFMT